MIVTSFFEALQAGKEIANAKTWKNTQLLTNRIYVLLVSLLAISRAFGHDFGLTDAQILSLATAVGIVVGLFNNTATTVSSTKVGYLPRDTDPRGPDGGATGDVLRQPKPDDADVFGTGARG